MSSTDMSAKLFAEACDVIPGGVNSPVRAFASVGGTPRFITSAKGCWLTDADDNRYAPGLLPTVRFDVRRDALVVHNNEEGFSEDDVWSICDIANSLCDANIACKAANGVCAVTNNVFVSRTHE